VIEENNLKDSDLKYIESKKLLEELKDFESYREEFGDVIEKDANYTYFDDEYNTPRRDNILYKNIEKITAKEFNLYMIYLMAIRNERVKEIIERIKIVFKLVQNRQDKYQLFVDKPNTIDDLEFFCYTAMDFEYSECLNENPIMATTRLPLEDFEENLNTLLENDDIKDEFNFENLCKIVYDYCKILKEEYFIYPDGINEKGALESLVINKEDFYFHSNLDDTKTNNILKIFSTIRNATPESIADLFYMYDYHNHKINQDDIADKTYITKNIKCALTKYHGISKKGCSSIIKYEDFSKNYSNYKNEEANFGYYITERSIRSKIAMMQKFIDECNYKYLFFN